MATLSRIQNLISSRRTSPASPTLLDTRIPSPFPSLQDRHEQTGELMSVEIAPEPHITPVVTVEPPEPVVKNEPRDPEVLPSLLSVEQSCLMVLNNLFAGVIPSDNWKPIVPSRRHSLPSLGPSTSQALSLPDTTPLATLVSNLRSQQDGGVMIQVSNEHSALLCELERHVEQYSEMMSTKDARLARLLVTLLQFSSKLSALHPATASLLPPGGLASSASQTLSETEIYDTLSRQASTIQLQLHGAVPNNSSQSLTSSTEQAVLWAQINHVLGDIQNLCHQRTIPTPFLSPYDPEYYDKNLPPEYDHDDVRSIPPMYETPDHPFTDLAKEKTLDEQSIRQEAPSNRESIVYSEKLKLDLDSVLMAIDRLYIVAPQLSNQRVELKGRKLEQMELARVAGAIEKLVDSGRLDDQRAVYRPSSALRKGKQKLEDKEDLDNLMSLIGQAASRTLDSQTVYVDDMQARIARAQKKDAAKRDEFVSQLVQHASHGRMHSQDAVLRPSPQGRKSSPGLVMGNLDNTSRSSISGDKTSDPNTMMTLPEFVKSHPGPPIRPPSPPGHSSANSPQLRKKSSKLGLQGRNRSNSAPPLAWLTGKTSIPRSPLGTPVPPPNTRMNITYVAEYRESLNMIAVQLRVDGMPRTSRLEAEVSSNLEQSSLILQCGSTTFPPLPLPVLVPAGKVDLFAASLGKPVGAAEYLDLKFGTSGIGGKHLDQELPSLLDAEQLRAWKPTSFNCGSCSLPIASGIIRYNDLPSDYWAELLDAWMCHPDQQVSAEIAKRAQGIWPKPGQALVGGGFLLFDSTAVNANALANYPDKDHREWRPVQCLCGALIGHRQEQGEGIVYRFKKYTVRPIAPGHTFPRIPFSAYVAADMVDLAHAHASYRFIIQDEETETPRILIWLFKPSIQLSYAGAAGSLIPSDGTITAAKVTFVIFGPTEPANSMDRYPAFKNAELLSYPIDLCRRLAASLKESNTVYPEARRTLDGMSIGWLQRA